MDQSPRFGLPFLLPGQAQKELTHNEAVQAIEILLCPVVDGVDLDTPPTEPGAGACYLVGAGASGDWTGNDGALACFTEGGWRFVQPVEAMQVVDKASGQILAFRSGYWESGIARIQELRVNGQTVVRGRQAAIGDPVGGVTLDNECRVAVSSILAALRAHGLIG